MLLNTERANATVTATDLEERVEQLFFQLPEPSARGASASPPALQRYAGNYRDGFRLVRVTTDGQNLTARPGLHHRASSRLVPEGGDVFLVEDDPSLELRFQIQNDRAHGYGRYHNGWFVGLAMGADGPKD